MRSFVSAVFLFGTALLVAQGVESRSEVRAQTPTASTTMPTPGEAIGIINSVESEFPGNPVFEGMSFDTLSDLIRALMTREKPATRGAREVTIFRQAAPAVVLLKTKEASGSGIILQNGMILTNRHVVVGVGTVQIFFKPDDLTRGESVAETRLGTVKFVDPERDLALIAPESLPLNYRSLKISARDDFDVGTDVYAIGHLMASIPPKRCASRSPRNRHKKTRVADRVLGRNRR
jgi:S1-C subfamily serine protease